MTMSDEQAPGGRQELGYGWRDVSVPLRTGIVHWPDNPPVSIERMLDISRGDNANVSALSMGSHTGTHMDAPVHFLNDGIGLDRMDLDATLGAARVIQIDDEEAIYREVIENEDIQPGDRVIFRTRNSFSDWWLEPFKTDFVYLSHEAAEFLADRRVLTVGVDYLSVGGYKRDGAQTHRALLGAGIWIIEGLRLNYIEPGDYELICLPLLITGADGAPARALLRPVGASPS
jgi:arylformamidase